MSFDTVKARVIKFYPDSDLIKLDKNILDSMKRFEKVARTENRGCLSSSMWRVLAKKGETISQTEKRYFEDHKLEFIHQYLTMLIDLYDYKPKAE